jgi:hypothetical protein
MIQMRQRSIGWLEVMKHKMQQQQLGWTKLKEWQRWLGQQ